MTKRVLISIFCSIFLLAGGGMVSAQQKPPQKPPQQEQPLPTDYEKWGKIAIDVAKLNYPDSKISDYQYKGRENLTNTQSKDTFELRVQTKDRTFTAKVMILFNPQTESLLSLSIEEVK
ncbi:MULTISPECIES: DUF3889 domain-containing protein [unclassified Fredinandcohnia]|uniref:DUF3889 domain-containing protein n=1 Tax=unclassified Fredinandcohnia TaxID=2837514 RepID=UPI0030FDAE8E